MKHKQGSVPLFCQSNWLEEIQTKKLLNVIRSKPKVSKETVFKQ